MSNRDALRKLSRKFPLPPEIDKIMDSLRQGTDLAVAITATSIVEAHLERLLTTKFIWRKKELAGQIFLNRGPLSDFHSKILVAEAFGHVTPNMAQELHSLKAIRNVFAHAKVPITFEHELIAREVASLRMFTAIQDAEKETGHKLELSPKAWFLLVTKTLLILFDTIQKHHGNADDAIRDALGKQQKTSQEKS